MGGVEGGGEGGSEGCLIADTDRHTLLLHSRCLEKRRTPRGGSDLFVHSFCALGVLPAPERCLYENAEWMLGYVCRWDVCKHTCQKPVPKTREANSPRQP